MWETGVAGVLGMGVGDGVGGVLGTGVRVKECWEWSWLECWRMGLLERQRQLLGEGGCAKEYYGNGYSKGSASRCYRNDRRRGIAHPA